MKGFVRGLVDLVFPPTCPTCGKVMGRDGPSPFCPACKAEISLIRTPLCPSCGVPFFADASGDHLCGECLTNKRPFSLARAVGLYQGTLLKALILFKYSGRTGLGRPLGEMMADLADSLWGKGSFDLVVPVPLHVRKLRQRGFNQAVILGRSVARRLAVPLDFTVLKRDLETPPQVGLGKKERLRNIKGAFTVAEPHRVKAKRILLVDDVYTTGSTIGECAAVLAAGGAKEISVLTLARAVPQAGATGMDVLEGKGDDVYGQGPRLGDA